MSRRARYGAMPMGYVTAYSVHSVLPCVFSWSGVRHVSRQQRSSVSGMHFWIQFDCYAAVFARAESWSVQKVSEVSSLLSSGGPSSQLFSDRTLNTLPVTCFLWLGASVWFVSSTVKSLPSIDACVALDLKDVYSRLIAGEEFTTSTQSQSTSWVSTKPEYSS